jgi:prepilin-type N-terminal cleavage/methylation domain-containing protein
VSEVKKRKKGFTLIEIVISMGISLIVLTVITTFFITNTNSLSMADIKSTLQQEGEDIKEAMIKSGTQSDRITMLSVGDGNSAISLLDSGTYYYSVLAANNSSDEFANSVQLNQIYFKSYLNPALSTQVEYVSFTLVNKELSMERLDATYTPIASTRKILSKNVNYFRIKPSDAITATRATTSFHQTRGIEVNIELYKKKGTIEITYPISMNIVFRNNAVYFN